MNSWTLTDYLKATECAEFISRSRLVQDAVFLAGEEAIKADGTTTNEDEQGKDDMKDGDKTACTVHAENSDEDADNEKDGKKSLEEMQVVDEEEADDESVCATQTANLANVDIEEIVRAKYFFAGGSARLMFQYYYKDLRVELDRRMGFVSASDWQFFAENSVAPGTPSSVNALMQKFGSHCSPLSKNVLFHAYEKCRGRLVKAVHAAAESTGNPALRGWAFELEQINLIRTSIEDSEGKVDATNSKGWSFRPTSEAEFDEQKFKTFSIVGSGVVVIWCLKWNQGCFDVAFYTTERLLRCSSPYRTRIRSSRTTSANCVKQSLVKALLLTVSCTLVSRTMTYGQSSNSKFLCWLGARIG
mmetsp:Transcript_29506/g.43523  ORF Transcript_29506/g.43523 Transcript_29506/m.43523 type:complete len:359 (-) Transcript_29506:148-1224(-)